MPRLYPYQIKLLDAMKANATILDACCGGRMMWHNKNDRRVLALDKRAAEYQLCDGRIHRVAPDIMGDFRQMPFPEGRFDLVLFDPPHLKQAGEGSWLCQKYGKLNKETWRADLRAGLAECFRVLKKGGVLVAKWNTEQISKAEFVALFPAPPVFVTGIRKTYLFIFHK